MKWFIFWFIAIVVGFVMNPVIGMVMIVFFNIWCLCVVMYVVIRDGRKMKKKMDRWLDDEEEEEDDK